MTQSIEVEFAFATEASSKVRARVDSRAGTKFNGVDVRLVRPRAEGFRRSSE